MGMLANHGRGSKSMIFAAAASRYYYFQKNRIKFANHFYKHLIYIAGLSPILKKLKLMFLPVSIWSTSG